MNSAPDNPQGDHVATALSKEPMMDSTPLPSTKKDDKTSVWATILEDWKVPVWSAFIAISAGLSYFAGYVVHNGKLTALGIFLVINNPPINQEYVVQGAGALLLMAEYATIIIGFAILLRITFGRIFKLLPGKLQDRVKIFVERRTWGWMVVATAIATSFVDHYIATALMKDADGLILKSANELNNSWVRLGVDVDQPSVYGYMFLTVSFLIWFIFISRWILTKFTKSALGKTTYATWAAINVLWMVAEFSFVLGVSTSFDPYPIVAFSNEYQYFGQDTAAVLLASDDKQYAFLMILKVNNKEKEIENETTSPRKIILYVPRSEVKWMFVLRQMPLHLISHYHDFKSLLEKLPANPEPVPKQ